MEKKEKSTPANKIKMPPPQQRLFKETVDYNNRQISSSEYEIWAEARAFGLPTLIEKEAACQRHLGSGWRIKPDQSESRTGFVRCELIPIKKT